MAVLQGIVPTDAGIGLVKEEIIIAHKGSSQARARKGTRQR